MAARADGRLEALNALFGRLCAAALFFLGVDNGGRRDRESRDGANESFIDFHAKRVV